MTANRNRNFLKVMLICAIFEFIVVSLYLFADFINKANNNGHLEKNLCYPENEYDMIEKEAERMVLNKDLVTEEYKLHINSFDGVEKTLSMRLYNDMVSVEVRAWNYGEDNVVIEYDRDYNSQNEKIFCLVRSIFIISFMCIFLLNVVILFIYLFLKELIYLIKYNLKK